MSVIRRATGAPLPPIRQPVAVRMRRYLIPTEIMKAVVLPLSASSPIW